MTIGALGSGSDFSPFIQHLGIPSFNIGYGGEDDAGVYHSVYDSYDHYKRFGDINFKYGIALAKTAGRTTLRLAGADILPFDFKGFHKTLNGYLTEVSALIDNLRESTEVENQMIKENRYVLAADPSKTYIPTEIKEPVPFINFSHFANSRS